jgi:hypothetical protein
MNRKDVPFRLRKDSFGDDGDGSFDGRLAVYNNVDLGGDVIVPGAFTKTIQERGSTIPLLWQHQPAEPIGTLALSDSTDALRVKGQLLMGLPLAQKAYLLLKSNIIRGMSIGYDTLRSTDNPDGSRSLLELKLYEGSIVTFPMNESAMVSSVKSAAEVEEYLRGLKASDIDSELLARLRVISNEVKRLTVPASDPEVAEAVKALAQRVRGYVGGMQ